MRGRRFGWFLAAAAPLLVAGQAVIPSAASAADVAPSPVGALSAAQAALLSTNVTKPVVVLLKDQHPSTPATASNIGQRSQLEANDQAPVLRDLSQTKSNDVKTYRTINAVAATVSPGEAQHLATDPAVSQVIPDSTVPLATPTAAATAAASTVGTPVAPPANVCAAPGKVQLDPQALQLTNTDSDDPTAKTARSLGFTGAGVKVAYIAEGINTNDPDFIRPNGSKVFVDYKDFSGDGANAPTTGGEAFLDASSIAAQGQKVYDVSHYSDLPLNRPCNIRIEGVAPGASLVGLKVFAEQNATTTSDFLQAIDYAVSVDHVDVLSESFGSNLFSDTAQDATRIFDEDAVAAGTSVVVSSGDAGVTSTIGSPASDPAVISAGATTSYRLDQQDGYGGARWSNGTWLDDNISSFSSGGFTQANRTVDIVAPGELNWALCTANLAQYADCANLAGKASDVQASGGTSESAPLTAGAAALVIQAFRSAHKGTSPTPAIIKQILTSTADDIAAPGDQQGAGILDSYQAVQAALSYQLPATKAVGSTLLTSASQLNATDAAGTPEHLAETVTNNGATPQTVAVSSRTIGAYQAVSSATVTLSDTASSHTTDWQGVNDNVEKVTFTVPAGANRLSATTTQPNYSAADAALHARVRMTLIDPTGALASYDVPQGDGNYDNAQVANPAAGTWTAYIYARDSADGGYTGPVIFGAGVANYQALGTVSPSSLKLAPGQSGTVTLNTTTPATPGDEAASLVLANGTGTNTVPVTLRSLVPLSPQAPTSFTGTLTGGNGRGPTYAEQFTYQMDVSQAPELNVNLIAASSADRIATTLVDPNGQTEASSANLEASYSPTAGQVQVPVAGQQDHVLNPANGRWTLLVNLYLPSGSALVQPYQVSIDEQPVAATATRLRGTLAAGKAITSTVKVTNHGSSPEEYFVDGRLNQSATIALAPSSNPEVALPLSPTAAVPSFTVPTDTTAIAAGVQASVPVSFDYVDDFGYSDPDLASDNTGTTATGLFAENPVQTGLWTVNPSEIGPYPASGAPAATADIAMAAQTQAFDPAVVPSTGDLWLTAINQNETLNPIVVQPGQTASIPVTVTPQGAKGSTVTGTLYVDDLQLFSGLSSLGTTPNGNQLAAIPYSYKIG